MGKPNHQVTTDSFSGLCHYNSGSSHWSSTRYVLGMRLPLHVLSLVLILNISIVGAESPNLITPLPRAGLNAMNTGQKQRVDLLMKRQTTGTVSLIRIDEHALTGESTHMALSSDKTLKFSKGHVERRSAKDFTWSGTLSDIPGQAVLVVRDGQITGLIQEGRNLYNIEPVGNGVHALIKVDTSKLPPDHPPGFVDKEQEGNVSPAPPEGFHVQNQNGPTEIDVLVAYTPAAFAASLHNLPAHLVVASQLANNSYQNSGINLKLNLVDAFQIQYSERGKDHDFILKEFVSNKEVYQRRIASGADVVVLIMDNNNSGKYCGSSNVLANASNPYAIVHHSCLITEFTFAHEIGHIQGALHNPESNPPEISQPYAHGYSDAAAGWGTIMAVRQNQACPGGECTRKLCWSTPDRRFPCWENPANGAVMGTGATHDNARMLNETASTVATFLGPPFGPIQDWSRGDSTVVGYGPVMYGDVTGDGKVDVIRSSDDSVWVRPSNGSEFLSHQLWISSTDLRGSRYFHDVNGDGKDDLIVVTVQDGVNVYPSDGSRFLSRSKWANNPSAGERIQFADVTGDRKADMISYNKHRVMVYPSTGSGFLSGRDSLYSFTNLDQPQFADVTGSGSAKMIVNSSNGVFAYRLDAPFPPQRLTTEPISSGQFHLADVTGDQRADLIVKTDAAVYVGRSDGLKFLPFRDWTNGPFTGSSRTFFADVTGDRKSDAIVVSGGTITVRPSTSTPPIFKPDIPMVEVPYVVKEEGNGTVTEIDYEKAAQIVGNAGLVPDPVPRPTSNEPWVAIAQQPSGGTKVPRGSKVQLTLRKGVTR